MNSQTPIVNVSGDHEETILRLAKHLGSAKKRRDVFNLIYGRGSKPRSKKQIVEDLGISGHSQVIQDALDDLQKHHLIAKIENKGQVKDGSRWLYGKDATVRANRKKIIKYADNPRAAAQVPTKRRPANATPVSFVKPVARRSSAPVSRAKASRTKLRIAVMVTNPSRASTLQTMIEARRIQEAVLLGAASSVVDVKLAPAATLDTLLDTLNIYRPTVLHFSGHGGDESLLFDNEKVGEDGGVALDFDMVARLLAATSQAPKLLVLVACDTVYGADRFLDAVPAVIAMADTIADDAACEFSARFYRSLAGGATIANALAQGRLLLEQKGYPDADLPTLLSKSQKAIDRALV